MKRLFKGKKFFLFLGILAVGVGCGLIIAVRLNVMPDTHAESAKAPRAVSGTTSASEIDLRTAFIDVAEMVGPAVVSISSERVHKTSGIRRFQFGPKSRGPFSEDDFFDDFFKDFFGDMPEREYKQVGLGTGVIIDASGFILTNDHVISGAEKITVTLPDGRSFKATPKGADPRSDLAIIKIDAKNLPVATLGNSDLVQTGEWVVAIGNPFGFAVNNPTPTVTVGVVSAVHRSLPSRADRQEKDRSYLDLIQTDAAINPGNSGGPLCNLEGKIIGINVAIVSTSGGYQGLGFAIPSNTANDVVGDLIKGKKVVYGWFGVTVQDITEDLAKFFGLAEKEGVLISGVLKDGPAKKGGLKEGDIIIKINGEKIKKVRDVLKTVGRAKPGQRVDVTIIRGKKTAVIPVIVGERPSEPGAAEGQEVKPEVEEEIVWRGIKVIDITPELAERYKIENSAGVIVAEIEPGSPAPLMRGDIIREINMTPIKNKAEYNKVVGKIKGDVLLRTDKGYIIVKEPEKK